MPSSKAVLHDITAHDLDPKKAHSRVATDGRLAGPAGKRAGLVKLPPELMPKHKVAEKTEPTKAEDLVPEQPVKVEAQDEKPVVTKPLKGKFEKKEAPKADASEAEDAKKG